MALPQPDTKGDFISALTSSSYTGTLLLGLPQQAEKSQDFLGVLVGSRLCRGGKEDHETLDCPGWQLGEGD